MKARFFQALIVSLFLGAVFWRLPDSDNHPNTRDLNDKTGFLFFYNIFMLISTLNPCVMTFPSQRAVFLREENAKLYTVGPYFIGKFIVDLIPTIIFPSISSLVVYWMVGLNCENAGKVFFFIFSCIL